MLYFPFFSMYAENGRLAWRSSFSLLLLFFASFFSIVNDHSFHPLLFSLPAICILSLFLAFLWAADVFLPLFFLTYTHNVLGLLLSLFLFYIFYFCFFCLVCFVLLFSSRAACFAFVSIFAAPFCSRRRNKCRGVVFGGALPLLGDFVLTK